MNAKSPERFLDTKDTRFIAAIGSHKPAFRRLVLNPSLAIKEGAEPVAEILLAGLWQSPLIRTVGIFFRQEMIDTFVGDLASAMANNRAEAKSGLESPLKVPKQGAIGVSQADMIVLVLLSGRISYNIAICTQIPMHCREVFVEFHPHYCYV